MTFLAPIFLAIGAAAAAAVVVLHFIARDRPPRAPLPTARFVPTRVERAATRAMNPRDLLLLAMRALLLLLAGAAFARPVFEPERVSVARVVVLDGSRAVADAGEARDSALAWLRDGDALVTFDSAARVIQGVARDTLAAIGALSPARPSARGSLSAALLAARHAAHDLRDRADSIELVLIAPLGAEEIDAATPAIRATWPGRVRLVGVPAAARDERARRIEVRASLDDPLGAAGALLPDANRSRGAGAPDALIVRTPASSADSAFARAGGRLIVWPRDPLVLGWRPRTSADTAGAVATDVDTVGAVVAGDVVLIAPFERRFAAPEAARVAARWVDGEPAAIERPLGAGCTREVAIPLDPIGDLALRAELRDLVIALAAPCGGPVHVAPIDSTTRAMLAGAGPLAESRVLRAGAAQRSTVAPWLLAAALLLALVEPLIRRRGAPA